MMNAIVIKEPDDITLVFMSSNFNSIQSKPSYGGKFRLVYKIVVEF